MKYEDQPENYRIIAATGLWQPIQPKSHIRQLADNSTKVELG